MKKQKIIGVLPLWDENKQSLWMLPNYFEAIKVAGGIPIMLPFTSDLDHIEKLASTCQGFLFPGGPDVHPNIYNQPLTALVEEVCPARDSLESLLLDRALKLDKAVLAICRGLQFINASLEGSLYQDLAQEFGQDINHQQKAPYHDFAHSVKLDGYLAELLDKSEIQVNSLHHQGIKDLAAGLEACAYAEDGLIEAFTLPSKSFVLAVQWHPEYGLNWESSKKIFKAFVDAC